MAWLKAILQPFFHELFKILRDVWQTDVTATDADGPDGERDRALRIRNERLREQGYTGPSK